MPIRITSGRGMLDCLADAARGSRALALGFEADASFDAIIAAHVEDEFQRSRGHPTPTDAEITLGRLTDRLYHVGEGCGRRLVPGGVQ